MGYKTLPLHLDMDAIIPFIKGMDRGIQNVGWEYIKAQDRI